jgi:hypothetical protein
VSQSVPGRFDAHLVLPWQNIQHKLVRKYCSMIFILFATMWSNADNKIPYATYVWQRVHSAELIGVIAAERAHFKEFRFLTLQQASDGQWVAMSPNWSELSKIAISRAGTSLIPVIRLPGSKPMTDIADLKLQIAALQVSWKNAAIPLQRIEIDFDCAESQLGIYRSTLTELKAHLAQQGVKLDITALPSWLRNEEFKKISALVDRVTLQVHSVQVPTKGLFDARKAEFWIRSMDAISTKPFDVALPAYGAKLLLDSKGKVFAVEHEAELMENAAQRIDIQTDPRAVQALLEAMKKSPPKNLAQWIWFRLPLASDVRAWKAVTLHAVMQGQQLQATREIQSLPNGTGGFDVHVKATGNMPISQPLRIALPAHCTGEGIADYQYKAGALVTRASREIRPGESIVAGWMRCRKPGEQD